MPRETGAERAMRFRKWVNRYAHVCLKDGNAFDGLVIALAVHETGYAGGRGPQYVMVMECEVRTGRLVRTFPLSRIVRIEDAT